MDWGIKQGRSTISNTPGTIFAKVLSQILPIRCPAILLRPLWSCQDVIDLTISSQQERWTSLRCLPYSVNSYLQAKVECFSIEPLILIAFTNLCWTTRVPSCFLALFLPVTLWYFFAFFLLLCQLPHEFLGSWAQNLPFSLSFHHKVAHILQRAHFCSAI